MCNYLTVSQKKLAAIFKHYCTSIMIIRHLLNVCKFLTHVEKVAAPGHLVPRRMSDCRGFCQFCIKILLEIINTFAENYCHSFWKKKFLLFDNIMISIMIPSFKFLFSKKSSEGLWLPSSGAKEDNIFFQVCKLGTSNAGLFTSGSSERCFLRLIN